MIGVNVDFRHWDDLNTLAADVAATGARAVRTVLKYDGQECFRWVEACHTAGLEVLGVIALESLFLEDGTRLSYEQAAGLYSSVSNLDAYQIGNEPDLDSPSSWTMPVDELNALLQAFRQPWYAYLNSRPHIGPGLASGQAAYLEGVDLSLVDGLALHPYAESRDTIDFYLSTYRQYWDGPIWFTEYGDVDMTAVLAERGNAFKFCLSDRMVPGFGLWDEADRAKPELQKFKAAAATNGGTMAKLEDVEKQADWPLGPRWTQNGAPMPIETVKAGERVGFYTDGYAIEKNGEVWPLVNANKESLVPLLERLGFRKSSG